MKEDKFLLIVAVIIDIRSRIPPQQEQSVLICCAFYNSGLFLTIFHCNRLHNLIFAFLKTAPSNGRRLDTS